MYSAVFSGCAPMYVVQSGNIFLLENTIAFSLGGHGKYLIKCLTDLVDVELETLAQWNL